MKEKILLLTGIALSLGAFAQVTTPPEGVNFKEGFYANKISPNGEWIVNIAGDVSLYNVATGQKTAYPGNGIGQGNAIADNGMMVGSVNDVATVMWEGETYYPEVFTPYYFCNINGITPDCTRITGYVNGLDVEQMWVPFVADIDAQGNVSGLTILPYPDTDVFGGSPLKATGVWISNDGKTIVGDVADFRGMYDYPIVYTEDESGEWSYSLPSESLFNPTGIYLPENPEWNEPVFPEPVNFMHGPKKILYQQACENYTNYGGEEPDPLDYMDDVEKEQYSEAYNFYYLWAQDHQAAINEYFQIYEEVLSTSPSFAMNDIALKGTGDIFAQAATIRDATSEDRGRIYKFNLTTGEYTLLFGPYEGLVPLQILPDGAMITALPVTQASTSYIVTPNSNEFKSIQELIMEKYPEIANWMDLNFPNFCGYVHASDDLSVICGGLVPDDFLNYDPDTATYYYSSYILTDMELSGVKAVERELNDGVYRVYNIQGVKVLETKNPTMLNNLPKGVYIVNGKKVML